MSSPFHWQSVERMTSDLLILIPVLAHHQDLHRQALTTTPLYWQIVRSEGDGCGHGVNIIHVSLQQKHLL